MTKQEEHKVAVHKGCDSDDVAATLDEGSASYNISRSKELIKKLEQTTLRSEFVVRKVRAFYETHQMLNVSKKISEASFARLRGLDRRRSRSSDGTDKS